jgi:hypothetical protein
MLARLLQLQEHPPLTQPGYDRYGLCNRSKLARQLVARLNITTKSTNFVDVALKAT